MIGWIEPITQLSLHCRADWRMTTDDLHNAWRSVFVRNQKPYITRNAENCVRMFRVSTVVSKWLPLCPRTIWAKVFTADSSGDRTQSLRVWWSYQHRWATGTTEIIHGVNSINTLRSIGCGRLYRTTTGTTTVCITLHTMSAIRSCEKARSASIRGIFVVVCIV